MLSKEHALLDEEAFYFFNERLSHKQLQPIYNIKNNLNHTL
jgi:hypothetical protein